MQVIRITGNQEINERPVAVALLVSFIVPKKALLSLH